MAFNGLRVLSLESRRAQEMAELIRKQGGDPFVAPAMRDLVSEQIDMVISDPVTSVQQARAGTIKAYAIAATRRDATVPEVPTSIEAGLPSFQISAWTGIFAPPGTPGPIVAKLNGVVNARLKTPEMQASLADWTMTPRRRS